MYVNYNNMNCDKIYAYYRHYKQDRLLVVANFGDSDENIAVGTPQHALDVMGMEPGTYQARELITGNKLQVTVAPGNLIELTVPKHNAMIIKLM